MEQAVNQALNGIEFGLVHLNDLVNKEGGFLDRLAYKDGLEDPRTALNGLSLKGDSKHDTKMTRLKIYDVLRKMKTPAHRLSDLAEDSGDKKQQAIVIRSLLEPIKKLSSLFSDDEIAANDTFFAEYERNKQLNIKASF